MSHRSKGSKNQHSGSSDGHGPSARNDQQNESTDRSLLYRLLQTPSPTGAECDVQQVLIDELAPLAHTIEHDTLGNVFFGLNAERTLRDQPRGDNEEGGEGQGGGDQQRRPIVMLEAHADQVGFLVKHIDENGYIYVDYLGGIDEQVLPGVRVVFTPRRREDGLLPPPPYDPEMKLVTGVFSKKATHLQEGDEKSKTPPKSELWIDIGTTSKEETEEKVRLGDTAVFELRERFIELENQRIVSAGLDDKAGLFAIAEAFKRCAKLAEQGELDAEVWMVSSAQEEIGLRGAIAAAERVRPDVAVAVDVVNASDDPGDQKKTTIPCVLGAGPTISGGPNTNPVVAAMLRAAAETCGVKVQQQQSSELEGNDSKSIQVAGHGIAVASVGIPNRAMHTQVEVCHLRDIDQTADVLVEFVRSVKRGTDFRPLRPTGLERVAGPAHR